jgi:hypothetical protein
VGPLLLVLLLILILGAAGFALKVLWDLRARPARALADRLRRARRRRRPLVPLVGGPVPPHTGVRPLESDRVKFACQVTQ